MNARPTAAAAVGLAALALAAIASCIRQEAPEAAPAPAASAPESPEPQVRIAPFGRPIDRLRKTEKAPMMRHEGGYYIRLLARDKPGTAATVAKRLAQQQISLESIVQRQNKNIGKNGGNSSSSVPVILITYATSEDAVRKALAAVGRDKVISGRPQVIRIEKN